MLYKIIDCNIEEIREYIEKNRNASDSEIRFIEEIMSMNSLKSVLDDFKGLKFFEFLNKLDEFLLGKKSICGRVFDDKSGYFTAEEISDILKWLYIQRYINAHDEDGKDEKLKEAALQDFISDKYDSGVHFFEEILQNIDDAIGRADISGLDDREVKIHWDDKKIVFEYPDRGFSFYDLMAITSLGNSIKKGDIDQASIGEKGIGFKSVFSVANNISIQSRFFGFDIDYNENRKTSVLQPSKVILPGTGNKRTVLTITFNEKFEIEGDKGFKAELRKWLFENKKGNYLNFSPFLFLKHISYVSYEDGECKDKDVVEIERSSIQEEFSLTEINDFKYLIYRQSLGFTKRLIENRWGKINAIADKDDSFCIDRPVEIAFPIIGEDNKEVVNNPKGLFYSYLPTEMVIDFPIYINVDVHLKSSRGRIREGDFAESSEWNKYVRDKLSQILVNAYIKITELYKSHKGSEISLVAEKLYVYIKKQTTKQYFSVKLEEFYNEILKKPVFLNISNDFVKQEDIWCPKIKDENDWNDMVEFCLCESIPGQDKQYLKDYYWYIFFGEITHRSDNWQKTVLTAYKGIKKFYQETKIGNNQKKNEIVLKVLGEVSSINNEYSVLFVEDKEGEYKICSKKDINDAGKVVFMHSEGNSEVDNDDISIYISKTVFDYGERGINDYKSYCELLKERGIVDEKNWKNHIENILKTTEVSEKFSVYECVKSVAKYLKYIDNDEIMYIDVPEEIKKRFSKYVIQSSVWDKIHLNNNGEYHKAIAKYLESSDTDKLGYEIFDLGNLGDYYIDYKIINLLLRLGVKFRPEIDEKGFDILTVNIMPNFSGLITDPDKMEFIYPGDEKYIYLNNNEVGALQQYLVEFVQNQNQNIVIENFKSKGLDLDKMVFIPKGILEGFLVEIQTTGPYGGITGYDSYWHTINSFRAAADDDARLFFGVKEKLNLCSGGLAFADSNKYPLFATNDGWKDKYYLLKDSYNNGDRYSEAHNKIIRKIINNPPKDILDVMRWTGIWNKVFTVSYAWHNITRSMTVKEFISCYKYLKRDDIFKLLPRGYSIAWDSSTPIEVPNASVQSAVVEYVVNELELNINKQIFVEYYGVLFEDELCISLEEYKSSNKDSKGLIDDSEYKYIIGIKEDTATPKTDYICMILKDKGKSISDAQKLEIADIVGEIKEEKQKNIIGLKNEESYYSEAVFKDGDFKEAYDSMIFEAKKRLPSVWKKSKTYANKVEDWGMKEWLCEPFKLDGYVFQGYGYQCPICGSVMRHHSLTGMKYLKRIKNADSDSCNNLPYLYLVSCLNCADMIERADKVKIKDYDEGSLQKALDHFINVCYCTDNFHIFNHSKLKTMKLYLEIDNHEFVEQIKISYLHMVLLLKLWHNTDN